MTRDRAEAALRAMHSRRISVMLAGTTWRLLYLTGFVWLFVPVFLILWTSQHLLALRSH